MITIKDKLSRLTLTKAVKLLGRNGGKLIRKASSIDFDVERDITITNSRFIVEHNTFRVEIALDAKAAGGIAITSSSGRTDCVEVAAVLSLILEEKIALGLAEPPPEDFKPPELLSHKELMERALAERKDKAFSEPMVLSSSDNSTPWADYAVTNKLSGKTYKVALRGMTSSSSFCSCPDFKINTIGTCKHLIFVQSQVAKLFSNDVLRKPYLRQRPSVTVQYDDKPSLRFLPGSDMTDAESAFMRPFIKTPIQNFEAFCESLAKAAELGMEYNIYPDAQEFIEAELFKSRIARQTTEIRANPAAHMLRTTLLNIELRPYQLDAIAFAASCGRAILADDMGLGKTIQGIGLAEFLAREAHIRKTLVVCPTSLKSQWRDEIAKFAGRSAQIVLGSPEERATQYDNEDFFTICNYEQVLRDLNSIDRVKWDLIILDEAQRIKNWESKTSRVIKSLNSRYALALTGTPLENRLEELFTIVSFIDSHQLGPAFKFMHAHRSVDANGKVLGYKNLDQIREKLAPILLRRTRAMVLQELPARQTNIVKLPPTQEQAEIDAAQRKIIRNIVTKKYISEMDILRLQKALLTARLAANDTFLVDKLTPHYSNKIPALRDMIAELVAENRKILLFSEWTTMLDLIEQEAIPAGLNSVRLDGSVPQKKRSAIVHKFCDDPNCRLFLTTNAGSTGLNLQAADTVINVDLPWNPAILEQRIARAHRMGQKKRVQVFVLISEGTIEDQMLGTLASKKELAANALDPNAVLSEVAMSCGIDELKRRLEVLIGAPEEAPVDVSAKNQVKSEIARKQDFAAAGGKLIAAAFELIGKMVSPLKADASQTPLSAPLFEALKACTTTSDSGAVNLTVSLPDENSLRNFANAIAAFVDKTDSNHSN